MNRQKVLYRRSQFGVVILAAVFISVLACVLVGLLAMKSVVFAVGMAVLLGIPAMIFSKMTITIQGDTLKCQMGPGLTMKKIKLQDIQSARAVTNPWYYGWGIHRIPRGWLYNVSGFSAVELALPGDKICRLGTDEPQALLGAIAKAKKAKSHRA